MRIYGTRSQLLQPGEKMQFNALCQITGYTWIVLVFRNAIRSDCICATWGGQENRKKVNLRRLCPLFTIFSGKSATSIS